MRRCSRAGVAAAVYLLAQHGVPGLGAHARMATTAASFGSTFTLSGATPDRRDGAVTVEGSWNDGPYELLASAVTAAGTYSVSFPIVEHGRLELRTHYPGGEADGTVLVP